MIPNPMDPYAGHFGRANATYGVANAIIAGAVSEGSVDLSGGQVQIGDTLGVAFKNATTSGLSRVSSEFRFIGANNQHLRLTTSAKFNRITDLAGIFRLLADLVATPVVQTGNFNVAGTNCFVICDGTSITATMVGSPNDGTIIAMRNANATSLTVARNGRKFDDVVANDTIAAGKGKIYIYNVARTSWYVVASF